MYDIKESGARIKKLRLKKGVTQEQIANDLGVTVETISANSARTVRLF